MARKRPAVDVVSYGLYDRFDPAGKALPRVVEFTTAVPAVAGQEFGYVLKIKQGRGMRLGWEIDHPRVPGKDGSVMDPFRGQAFVRTSDFDFFLGDALWEPLANMLGEWTLTTTLDEKVVAKRTFEVLPAPGPPDPGDGLAWDELPMQ